MGRTEDWLSQMDIPGCVNRFKSSAAERESVKQQLAMGKSPVNIETEDRVMMRAQHLGLKLDEAESIVFAAREQESTLPRSGAAPVGAPRGMPASADFQNVGLERIIGSDDLLSAAFLKRGAECSKSVCCVLQGPSRIGTGFLICPGVLMTNAHVIPSYEVASQCSAEFNYEDRLIGGGTEESVVFRLLPERLFLVSPAAELDYAIVAVEKRAATKSIDDFGFLRMDPTLGKVLRGESLNIIQHPSGRPKQVAIRQNRFTALQDAFMHYEADTQPGSSGSPVFNDQWQLVCLHHAAVPLKDARGNILTKNNQIWKRGEDPSLIKWIGNEGVRVSRIVADINRRTGEIHPLLSEVPKSSEVRNTPVESLDSHADQLTSTLHQSVSMYQSPQVDIGPSVDPSPLKVDPAPSIIQVKPLSQSDNSNDNGEHSASHSDQQIVLPVISIRISLG